MSTLALVRDGIRGALRTAFRPFGMASDKLRDWWAGAARWQRWTVYAVLFVVALILPLDEVEIGPLYLDLSWIDAIMAPEAHWSTLLLNPIGTYILLAIGLNVVVGQAGLLDLGYVAFYAIGGYTLAVFGKYFGFSFWECVILAIVLAVVSGVILGTPTLRLRGDYLAIVTLGFGEIVRVVAEQSHWLGETRGIVSDRSGNVPYPPSFFEIPFFEKAFGFQPFHYSIADPRPFYYLLLGFGILIVVFVRRVEHSRVGRSWAAIREDEDAAELMGVPTLRFKIVAFMLGAAVGGVVGVVYGTSQSAVFPSDFPFILSATILAAVVLGGSGNLPGVVLGAFLIAWLPERVRGFQDYRNLIFGAALVLMMIFRPEGILPSRRRRAELAEGTGGMGSLGAEVAGPTSEAGLEVASK